MPFVQGKCENCGGILTVDSNLKAANCPFCGAAYVVQDSINYFNTSINVENLHANVVNITDESSSEARLKAADAYIKIGDYEKAEKEYTTVTELAPQNYRGWLGLIDSRTHHYSKRIRSYKEINKLKEYANSVLTLAPAGKGKDLLKEFTDYIEIEEEKNNSEKKPLELELANKKEELRQVNEEINTLQSVISENESKIADCEKHKGGGCGALIIGIPLIAFGILIYKLFFSDGDWFDDKIMVFIAFVGPCILGGAIFIVLSIVFSVKSKQYEKQIADLKSEQTELKNKISAKNERIKTINDKIIDIQKMYSIFY